MVNLCFWPLCDNNNKKNVLFATTVRISKLWQPLHFSVNYLFKNYSWAYINPPLGGAKWLDHSYVESQENACRCLLTSCLEAKGDIYSAPQMLLVTIRWKNTDLVWLE